MKPNISQIEEIEQKYRVKVLFACIAGSRAWGLESTHSDKDLALIYHRSQEWYISLSEKSDTIDLSLETSFDGFGWDLTKVLQGLLQSNAIIYDWLQVTTPFIGCPYTNSNLQTISQQCFNVKKVIFHYLGLGNNLLHRYKLKEDIQIKSYMLLIRSTLAAIWVKEKGTPPPVMFSELLTIAESEPAAVLPIHKIVMLKKQAKPDKYIPKIAALDEFIAKHRRGCAAYAEALTFEKELPLTLAEKLLHDVIFQEGNREAFFDQFISRDKKEV